MFEKNFPNLDWWINGQGWVELDSDEYSHSWVRILEGVRNTDEKHKSNLISAYSSKVCFNQKVKKGFKYCPSYCSIKT